MSTMAACYPNFELPSPSRLPTASHKDYSRPLHVDCSVEYELPNQAKPPEGANSEPLLMIHPCYYRRAESQRRSPFINNLPTRGLVPMSTRRSTSTTTTTTPHVPRAIPQQQQQQQQYTVRYLGDGALQQNAWSHPQIGPPPPALPLYPKPASGAAKASGKRDALLCGGGDFSSGSDSGVSAGHWTDSDRSPDVRLLRDFQPTDSGITTPVSLDDKNLLSDLLVQQATCGGDVTTTTNNNNHSIISSSKTRHRRTMDPTKLHPQPAVGVAAVAAACKTCRPPVQRGLGLGLQQPWAGVIAPAQCSVVPGAGAGRTRGVARAVEPGPEHAASRRGLPAWGHTTGHGAVKRSRTTLAQDVTTTAWAHYLNTQTPQEAAWPSAATEHGATVRLQPPIGKECVGLCCKNCPTQPSDWDNAGYYAPAQCLRSTTDENSRILWNNESMLRLFQV